MFFKMCSVHCRQRPHHLINVTKVKRKPLHRMVLSYCMAQNDTITLNCLGEKALKTLPDEKSALLFFHIPVCTENKKALVLKDKCDFSKILYQAAVFHKVLFRGGMCMEMAVIDR